MTIVYWFALGIVVGALIGLVIGAIVAYKKITHTLNNIKEMQSSVQREITRYSSEADSINQRIQQLNGRVTVIKEEATTKANQFTELSERTNELSNTLTVINDNKNELAKNALTTSGKQAKKYGPKLLKLVGQTLKKTYKKQKARYIG